MRHGPGSIKQATAFWHLNTLSDVFQVISPIPLFPQYLPFRRKTAGIAVKGGISNAGALLGWLAGKSAKC
jgi:hypothetical protein